jgi:hypothetical protein
MLYYFQKYNEIGLKQGLGYSDKDAPKEADHPPELCGLQHFLQGGKENYGSAKRSTHLTC